MRQSGLDLATYLKYTGMTIEALRAQLRPQAENQVKVRLALEKIASLEALTVSEEETNEEYQKLSDAYNIPVEQIKAMVSAEDLNADIVIGKALKLVRENAVIGGEKAKKPAAKKTAAKKTTAKKADAEAETEEATEKKPAAKKTTAKKTTTVKKTAKADEKAE